MFAFCFAFAPAACADFPPGWDAMNPEIPGVVGCVNAMVFREGSLYIGGDFTCVGEVI